MLNRNLHDTEQDQQHSIQFVKLVYYIPALSFSWSINYSQYCSIKKNMAHRKKLCLQAHRLTRPSRLQRYSIYHAVHRFGLNDVIHIHARTHTYITVPSMHEMLQSREYPTCLLKQRKGLCDANRL